MKTNKEKFKTLVSKEKTNTIIKNRERIKNRTRLRESQDIALKVLTKLDELNWSQKRLAEELGVSPQQVSKIVKGRENLTLETQLKLQQILDIPILASYYERQPESFFVKQHYYENIHLNTPSKEGQSFFKEEYVQTYTAAHTAMFIVDNSTEIPA